MEFPKLVAIHGAWRFILSWDVNIAVYPAAIMMCSQAEAPIPAISEQPNVNNSVPVSSLAFFIGLPDLAWASLNGRRR